MHRRRAGGLARPWWLLLLTLLTAAGATGVVPPPGQVPYGAGLLFELRHPRGGAPSYVFGTIHSEDPRVLDLPPPVIAALAAADTLVLEVVPDAAALAAAAAAMRLAEGTRLSDLVAPELYQRCVQVAASRGLPESVLLGLKPWAVMTLISMPRAQTGEFLDRHLYRLAHDRDQPTLGLETTAEQLAVFEQFSLIEQRALLRAALAEHAQTRQRLAELLDAYLRGDLRALLALSDVQVPGLDPALRERFREVLVDARNRRMLERIEALPEAERYFIAVGALHLPGETGLLSRLAQRGYRVRRLH
jgi:uncharacterized protein YbaP (TraB family)